MNVLVGKSELAGEVISYSCDFVGEKSFATKATGYNELRTRIEPWNATPVVQRSIEYSNSARFRFTQPIFMHISNSLLDASVEW